MVTAAPPPRSGDPLTPGLRIGPYLLLAPLGSGGSSRVWAVARTGQLGFTKRMALKVMRQDKLASERARQRFDREARLGAQLRHANLRAVHELGSHEGRPHMALAWVDTSLEELLEHAPGKQLDPDVVCWFGIQACAALSAAHAHVNPAGQPCPIVHGDVSPGNILLTLNGHVLLADLAAEPDPSPAAATQQRSSKSFFGSLGYAAPEALRGESVDGRADLFSLGCVLYEALCGSFAFEAEDEHSLLFQVLERGPVALAQRAPGVPEPVASVVHRALERSVEHRFASADEMRHALCRCAAGLTPFELERRSARLIGKVLGERVRQREEQMRLTYQHFASSQLERTDTLPIGSATRRRESTTLRGSLPDAPPSTQRGGRVSIPSGVEATTPPGQKRRAFWLVPAALLLASGAYLALPQRGQPSEAASAPPAPQQREGELSRERQGLTPQSHTPAPNPSSVSARGSNGEMPLSAFAPGSSAQPPAAFSMPSNAADAGPAKPLARRAKPPPPTRPRPTAATPGGRVFVFPDSPYQDVAPSEAKRSQK